MSPKSCRSGGWGDGAHGMKEVACAKGARFADSFLLLARSKYLLPGLALAGALRGGPATAAIGGARNGTAGPHATGAIKQEALAAPGARRIPLVVTTDV